MKKIKSWISCGLVLSAILFTAGCVTIKSFPNSFRPGDTVTLSIGSLDGATKSNLTITYYDDLDTGRTNPIDLTPNLKQVFKLYPDKTSKAWTDISPDGGGSVMNTITSFSGHGPWLTVVRLNLPDSTVLSAGTGKILVVPGTGVTAPNASKLVQGVEIAVEILPGDSAKDAFKHYAESFSSPVAGLIGKLQPLTQVVVRPFAETGLYGKEIVAAAEYVLNIPITDTINVPDDAVRVYWDDRPSDSKTQVQLIYVRIDDIVKVMVISPGGALDTGLVRFSVVLVDVNNTDTYTFAGAPSLVSATYYDVDGNVTVGTDPEVLSMY